MADLQGLVSFPGVEQPLAVTYVLSHGITPSVCTLTMVPQLRGVAQGGELVFRFGPVVLVFPGCRINFIAQSRGPWGITWTLQILDRRWKWAFGEISGRHDDKTPQQLASMLLKAMGEVGFDVSALPNDARPEVDWNYSNPAAELASLCDSLGCRIVLGLDNRVKLRRMGVGFDLPVGGQLTEGFLIDPPERPDILKVVGGPTIWQTQWKLEAVGEETDGYPTPIELLSYKPSAGWGDEDPHTFGNVANRTDRESALRSVYRWYRIKQPADGRSAIPGCDGPVTDIDAQVLPVSGMLLDTEQDAQGRIRHKQAYIDGIFADNEGTLGFDNSTTGTRLKKLFVLDGESGIVRFAEPVFQYEAGASGIKHQPAELYLTCTHGIRSKDTLAEVRYSRQRRLPGILFGTGARIVRHEEIVKTVKVSYDSNHNVSGPPLINQVEVDRQADHYLTAIQSEYQAQQAKDIEYAGIRAIEPDGAIAQVSWTVGPQGTTTRASRNSEFDLAVPSYTQRRRRERANRVVQEEQQAKIESARKATDKGKVGTF